MDLLADLHIHSRFSRATSKDLDFVTLHRAALEKGIGLVGTGDFTHPGWMAEIEDQLEPAEEGLFRLRPELRRAAEEGLPAACTGAVRFVLEVEISNIYKRDGRVRKNHNLVFVPSLAAAHALIDRLSAIGNVASDGRPILGLDARDLLEMTLEVHPAAFLVPAHIWTPWFSVLGSKSGFDSVEECFGDLAAHIFAVETGLSSDPPMNWRLSDLDRFTLISNSDAHSAGKLGREVNVLDLEPSYEALLRALKHREGFAGTIEFFPEEGKYHLDGHRKCGLRLEPEQTAELDGRCPRCDGLLTVGVLSRVAALADRPAGARPAAASEFCHLVPIAEVLAQLIGVGPASKKVQSRLRRLLDVLGPELRILRELPLEAIARADGDGLAEAVRRVRDGELEIAAGFDGEFGTVKIFSDSERADLCGQMRFFASSPPASPSTRPKIPSEPKNRKPPPLREATTPPAAAAGVSEANPHDHHLAGLDPNQLEAATAPAGPLLVTAGPGTGKTRTLVARILHQVRDLGLEPGAVLAVTFTNQAAEELALRLGRLLDTAERPLITTFHGLGQRILTEVTGSAPRMVSDTERAEIGREILPAASPREINVILDRISLAKQHLDPTGALAGEDGLLDAYTRHEAALERRGAIDVDDLVLRAHGRLAHDPEARARFSARFHCLCVDEYQDVNDVQAGLIRLLAPSGASLCAIGDPDQAIYGFRGARPGHFARFGEHFPGTRVVTLETSYRLTHPILAAARSVVAASRPLQARHDGPPVEVIACPTANSEAEQIVIRLERIVGGTSTFAVDSGRGSEAEMVAVGFGDIAVLSRTRSQRRNILDALARSGIPCRSVGEDEAHDPRSEKVAVMTMHAAKGREFSVVFVTGVERGLLPLAAAGLAADPEEERRLLYVAITRASRLVVLSHARRRQLWGTTLPGEPSPFLEHLPRDAVIRTRPEGIGRKPPDGQMRLF